MALWLVRAGTHGDQEAALGEKYHPADYLDTIIVGNIAYKVINSHSQYRLGDAFDRKTANGIFLIIDIEMENKGTKTVTMLSDNHFKLIDSEGREFETDNGAWIYLKNDILLKQLRPSLPTKAK